MIFVLKILKRRKLKMINETLERIRVYEINLYRGKPVRDVSADLQVGHRFNQGWFAEQRPITKGLDLTQEEADWFANC